MQILTHYKGENLVTNETISKGLNIEIRSLNRNIDKFLHNLEVFGAVRFEITPGTNKRIYYFNENQALFLATLSRNSETVVEFKKELVQAYSKLRNKQLSRKELITLALEAEEERERLEKENSAQRKVIENQNELNSELINLKATQTRTALKAVKNDIGVEINLYIGKLFHNIDSFPARHKAGRELYSRMTGKYYPGASKASLDSKKEYLAFLKEQVNKLQ